MGRKPLSDEEKAERQRQMQIRSNDKRRSKYASDPDYRAARVEAGNAAYWSDKEFDTTKRDACLENAVAEELGSMQLCWIDGKEKEARVLSTGEMAKAMGFNNPVSLYNWQKQGLFPTPAVEHYKDVRRRFYDEDHARRLLAVMAEHFEETLYLKSKDEDTIAALFNA